MPDGYGGGPEATVNFDPLRLSLGLRAERRRECCQWRIGHGDLESHFHWNGDVFTDGQVIDTVTPWHGHTRVNDTKLRAEPVWNPDDDTWAWRAIWAYSARRARRDQKTLAAQEARARGIVAGEKNAKTARFVTTSGDDRALDEASLARVQSLVGLKAM